MAFLVDDERRVHDPDRGLTLVFKSSEKEGAHDFALVGPDVKVGFVGHVDATRIEGADPALPAPLRTLVTWRIILWNHAVPAVWTREDTEQAIVEAMSAWKYHRGRPEGQRVEVEFT